MKSIIYISAIILLSSCFKEETAVPRKDRGGLVSFTSELGPTYDMRSYFSMSNKSNSANINKYDWDLALSADSSMPYIRLNTGIGMYAYKSDKSTFENSNDTDGLLLNRLNDYPCGDPDSLALTGILENDKVYLIDLGTDASLQKYGFMWLKAHIENGAYKLEYCRLGSSDVKSEKVEFLEGHQHRYFDFQTSFVTDEPSDADWDFMLTQYQHVYYDPFQTYSVVGCIINPNSVVASVYKGNKPFIEVDAKDLNSSELTDRWDVIGFSWKYYDLNSNTYVIRPEKTYFLKYKDGRLFKLHFIGFYNDKGEKGTPTFEFIEL